MNSMFETNSLLTINCIEMNVCLHIFNKDSMYKKEKNITSVKRIIEGYVVMLNYYRMKNRASGRLKMKV